MGEEGEGGSDLLSISLQKLNLVPYLALNFQLSLSNSKLFLLHLAPSFHIYPLFCLNLPPAPATYQSLASLGN